MNGTGHGDRPVGPSLPAFFADAYRDPAWAVLEGFHPARHAIAFGHSLEMAVTGDAERLSRVIDQVAPECRDAVFSVLEVVGRERFEALCPRSLSSPLLSVARRPQLWTDDLWRQQEKPLVYLEGPRNPGNVGAVIRVVAAAGGAGVVVGGEVDPWGPVVVRSAAGLQFALPVGRGELPSDLERPVVALDIGGVPVTEEGLPAGAVLVVGAERRGLSGALRARADRVVGVPMRPGVSSLNLATAVAAGLYAAQAAALARTGTAAW